MRRIVGLMLIVAILLVGVLIGCSQAPSDSNDDSETIGDGITEENKDTWPRTIEDDYGNEVTLDEKPENLAVLYFGHIESLIVLDHPPFAAAMADMAMNGFGTLKEYLEEITVIDLGSPREVNIEKILEVSPDVIIGTGTHLDVYDDLNKIEPTLLFDSSDWEDNLNDYAKVLGAEEKAEEYISEIKTSMSEAREELSAYKDKTFVFAWDQGKNTFLAFGTAKQSQHAFFDDEFGLGLAAPEGYPEEAGEISLEALGEFDPDYIFIVGSLGTEEDGYEQNYLYNDTMETTIWNSLEAVKSNNVHYLDAACVTGSPLGVKLAVETIVDSVIDE